ncbi:hypothetical protein ANTQUA_LOCUS4886 [Anthophora quadrimaculata]
MQPSTAHSLHRLSRYTETVLFFSSPKKYNKKKTQKKGDKNRLSLPPRVRERKEKRRPVHAVLTNGSRIDEEAEFCVDSQL